MTNSTPPRGRERPPNGPFGPTFHPEGPSAIRPDGTRRAPCSRESLIFHVARLIDEARDAGLPTPDDCPRGSLETCSNASLYRAGVSLKKRLSAHRALAVGQEEHLLSAQMQGA